MSSPISPSILQAASFLTRPLSLVQDAPAFCVLQSTLRSNLHVAFASTPERRLVMTFTASTPPRPIMATCVATGVLWHQWMQFFGQQEFDLIIEETSVVARYHDGSSETFGFPAQSVIIWSAPCLTAEKCALLALFSPSNFALVPTKGLEQSVSSRTTTRSGVIRSHARRPFPAFPLNAKATRTFAQQLIDSGDDHDAEELFVMISKSTIICPTPRKAHFHLDLGASLSPLSTPEPSENSRPSSRTSAFSSYFSDAGSLVSAPTTPSTSGSFESIDPEELSESNVFVDDRKANKTKYLYQGGLSSTLTGGVMLGCPSKTAPAPAASQVARPAISGSRHLINRQVQQHEKCGGPLEGRGGAGRNYRASWLCAPAATAVGTASFLRRL